MRTISNKITYNKSTNEKISLSVKFCVCALRILSRQTSVYGRFGRMFCDDGFGGMFDDIFCGMFDETFGGIFRDSIYGYHSDHTIQLKTYRTPQPPPTHLSFLQNKVIPGACV